MASRQDSRTISRRAPAPRAARATGPRSASNYEPALFVAPLPIPAGRPLPKTIPIKPPVKPPAPKVNPLAPPFGSPKWPKPKPFGRRPPGSLPYPLKKPLPYGVLRPLRPFTRLLPVIGWAITAYEIYDFWQSYQAQLGPGGIDFSGLGEELCQTGDGPFEAYREQTFAVSSLATWNPPSPLCGTSAQVPTGPIDAIPAFGPFTTSSCFRIRRIYIGPYSSGGTRMSYHRGFQQIVRRVGCVTEPGTILPPSFPEWEPIELPSEVPTIALPELPYPYPFAPEFPRVNPVPDLPVFPDEMPDADEDPVDDLGNPWPPGNPTTIPSVDLNGDGTITPGTHDRVPPNDPDREKKKRPSAPVGGAWSDFLKRKVGSYMEYDDMIAALYQGLNWKVRRWRGRDGIWRDRHITSSDRAAAIARHLDTYSIEDGLKALIWNETVDRVFGAVGQAFKRRTQELGREGLWSNPSLGVQSRISTPFTNSEWEAQKKLMRDEFQRKYKPKYYWVRYYNAQTRRWHKQRRVRPVTQIPWYRQSSLYPRFRRLTGGPNAYRAPYGATYYAPTASPRSIR